MARTIVGELKPISGGVTIHPNMRVGYFTQVQPLSPATNKSLMKWAQLAVERLSEEETGKMTALQRFMEETGAGVSDARAFLGRWGLGGKLASATGIGMLSGGQKVGPRPFAGDPDAFHKVRLALALLLWRPPHLLFVLESGYRVYRLMTMQGPG